VTPEPQCPDPGIARRALLIAGHRTIVLARNKPEPGKPGMRHVAGFPVTPAVVQGRRFAKANTKLRLL
jgi:hypothetical protein